MRRLSEDLRPGSAELASLLEERLEDALEMFLRLDHVVMFEGGSDQMYRSASSACQISPSASMSGRPRPSSIAWNARCWSLSAVKSEPASRAGVTLWASSAASWNAPVIVEKLSEHSSVRCFVHVDCCKQKWCSR